MQSPRSPTKKLLVFLFLELDMKLQHIAAAVALVAAGAANASLSDMNSGNSSVGFIAYDNLTTNANQGSVFIDLGISLNDFAPLVALTGVTATFTGQANYAAENTKIVWDFGASTISVNGTQLAATNDFSAFASFVNHSDDPFKWAVIAGDSTLNTGAQRILTTGQPTASNLTLQNSSATAGMVGSNGVYLRSGVSNAVDNGSFFTDNSGASTYLASGENFGTNWQNKLKWTSTATAAANQSQLNFWFNFGNGQEWAVGQTTTPGADTTGLLNAKGTWTLDKSAQTLTWATATTVPEPESYALALLGLAAAGAVARRRQAK